MDAERLIRVGTCLLVGIAASGCRTSGFGAAVGGGPKTSLLAMNSVPAQSEPEIQPTSATESRPRRQQTDDDSDSSKPQGKPSQSKPSKGKPVDGLEDDEESEPQKEGNLLSRWFSPRGKGQKPKRMTLPLSDAADSSPSGAQALNDF